MGYTIIERDKIKEFMPKISKFGHYKEIKHRTEYINSIKKRIEKEDTFNTIDRLIGKAFDEMVTLAGKHKIPHRDAAHAVAVSRIIAAMKSRGWI